MTSTTLPKHARKARIRKPNRRPGAFAAVTFKRALAVFLAAFFLGAVFPQLGAAAAHAATVTAPAAHTKLWWDGTTCRQFAAWERKPSAERFRHLAAGARHADTYLRVDVALLADDVHNRASRYTLHVDRSFVAADCTYTGDQGD